MGSKSGLKQERAYGHLGWFLHQKTTMLYVELRKNISLRSDTKCLHNLPFLKDTKGLEIQSLRYRIKFLNKSYNSPKLHLLKLDSVIRVGGGHLM